MTPASQCHNFASQPVVGIITLIAEKQAREASPMYLDKAQKLQLCSTSERSRCVELNQGTTFCTQSGRTIPLTQACTVHIQKSHSLQAGNQLQVLELSLSITLVRTSRHAGDVLWKYLVSLRRSCSNPGDVWILAFEARYNTSHTQLGQRPFLRFDITPYSKYVEWPSNPCRQVRSPNTPNRKGGWRPMACRQARSRWPCFSCQLWLSLGGSSFLGWQSFRFWVLWLSLSCVWIHLSRPPVMYGASGSECAGQRLESYKREVGQKS